MIAEADLHARAEVAWWSWPVAALISASICLVYLPGLLRVFDYHDSFYYFSYLDHANCAAHPQAAYLVFTGRPLFMLINCAVANLMNTVSDAHAVRLLGIAVLSASGTLIVRALRVYGVNVLVAVGVVIGLVSVPGWQLVLSMSQTAAVVWSLPPVLAAFFLVCELAGAEGPMRARERWSCAGAIALIVIAALTYQQNTSILFALCAIPVVLAPLAHARRVVFWALIVYGIGGTLYLIVHRIVVLPLVLPALGTTADRFGGMAASVLVSTDIAEKIRFFRQLTPRALALWFLDPPDVVPLTIACIAVAAAVAAFKSDVIESRIRSHAAADWRPALQRLALVAMLIPLSVAPVVVVQGGLVVYRHIIAYQWLIVLFIVTAATRLAASKMARGVLVAETFIVALSAGIYANWNFDRNLARINAKELEFIQAHLGASYKKLPADIFVIQPGVTNLGAFGPLAHFVDEFGRTSTMYTEDVPWVVYGAAIEMGVPRERLKSVAVARINPDNGQLQVLDNEGKVRHELQMDEAILIDMREFASQVRRGEF